MTTIVRAQLPSRYGDIRVVIVDDDSLVRRALKAYVNAGEGMVVVGEADDGDVSLGLVERLAPDVVLMDLRMPRLSGLNSTAAIMRKRPATRVIAITTFGAAESVVAVLRAGAAGYLMKDATPEEIVDAIRLVHSGLGALSPQVSGTLIAALRDGEDALVRRPSESEKLSSREHQIVEHLASGKSNREIALALHVSEGTVKARDGEVERSRPDAGADRGRSVRAGDLPLTGQLLAERLRDPRRLDNVRRRARAVAFDT